MNPEKTGAFICELRKNNNLTQEELAEKIGVTRKAVSRWETGRGYPDIELLPDLAESLSVSINELLCGEKIQKENIADIADINLRYICQSTAIDNKKNRKKLIFISIISAIIFTLLSVFLTIFLYGYINTIKGSENCIVSKDYSYLTYYGEKYIPINTGLYNCSIGEKLVSEVQVQGADIFTKLMFSDSLYSVHGVTDTALVYLQTDYDELSSQYYVKESKQFEIQNIINNFAPNSFYAVLTQSDDNEKEFFLENTYLDILNSLEKAMLDKNENCDINRSKGQESIPIIAYEKNNIFFESYGEILFKNQKYYWYDYNGQKYPHSTAHKNHPYSINKEFYSILDTLFSYMYK